MVALSGMVVIVDLHFFAQFGFDPAFIFGILSGIFCAIYLLVSKKVLAQMDIASFILINLFASSVFLGIINLLAGEAFYSFGLTSWAILTIQGVVCRLIAWLAINYAIKHIRTTRGSLSLLAQAFATAILAWAFLGEASTLQMVFGGIMLLLGIATTFINKPLFDFSHSMNSKYWILGFLDRLPDEFVNDSYYDKLIQTINSIDGFVYLYIKQYVKFSKENRNAAKEVLEIVHSKIKIESQQIRLSEYPFKEALEIFEGDYTLIKESYFQQYTLAKSSASFDYQLEGFANIYKSNKDFLFDFFKHFYSEYNAYGSNEKLNISFIWGYSNRINEIEKVIDFLINSEICTRLGGRLVSVLFNHLDTAKLISAFNFLKNLILKHQNDGTYIEIIFDTIRTNLQSRHNELLLYFLSLNNDVEFFRMIDWVGNLGVQMGNVIWGELHAKRWEKVLDVPNTSKDQLWYIAIKKN